MCFSIVLLFFFEDSSTTEIYTYLHTLSLHDALPISAELDELRTLRDDSRRLVAELQGRYARETGVAALKVRRSEEHTSELQSLMRISYAVFCLKKKNIPKAIIHNDTNTHITTTLHIPTTHTDTHQSDDIKETH